MAAVQGDGPTVDAEVLTAIAAAIRDRLRLRFDYRRHDGSDGVRDVEPHRVVSWGRRWYLVAFDTDRQDWRTFRVDRVRPRIPAGPRFTPRRAPGGDVTAYVERTVGRATWRYRARVLLHAPAASLAGRLPPAVELEPVDERTCIATAGADDPAVLALYLGLLDAPELARALARLARRYARAAGS